jgi:hypothetical protein
MSFKFLVLNFEWTAQLKTQNSKLGTYSIAVPYWQVNSLIGVSDPQSLTPDP